MGVTNFLVAWFPSKCVREWDGVGWDGMGWDFWPLTFTAPTYLRFQIPDLSITISESSLPSMFLYAESRINTHFSVSISVFWRPLNSNLEMPAVPVFPCCLMKVILIVLTLPHPPFSWLCTYTHEMVFHHSLEIVNCRDDRCLTSLIGLMYKVPRGTLYSGLCFLICCSAFCIYIPCSTSLFHKHTLSWTH